MNGLCAHLVKISALSIHCKLGIICGWDGHDFCWKTYPNSISNGLNIDLYMILAQFAGNAMKG